ncbi:hypothetical protein BDV41DRAFT_554872 [Aspergillus transmontanensis]|uniref:Uncharacterized protein n=1 Tax=Aspergillus transmontanensis TaxID=1034304 RepID=A0A5N6VG87_9EURO|nr:hypothetical protein BDV41DRAFT_554872 [Aspergillus transmontanensis]
MADDGGQTRGRLVQHSLILLIFLGCHFPSPSFSVFSVIGGSASTASQPGIPSARQPICDAALHIRASIREKFPTNTWSSHAY